MGAPTSRLRALRWVARAISPFTTAETLKADWPRDEEWAEIFATAEAGMVLPALRIAIESRGLRAAMPPKRADHLRAIFVLHVTKRRALRRQMIALNQLFASGGIRPVWLKGAETLFDDDFAQRSRPMFDLDAWFVGEEAQQTALSLMAGAGWTTFPEDDAKRGWERSHHFKPLQHPDWPVPVEVHRTPVVRHWATILPLATVIPAIRWFEWEGGAAGRLDPVSGLSLAAIQASSMAYSKFALGRVPLMKSLDVVERIQRDFSGHVPEAVLERFKVPQAGRSLDKLLTFTAAYFGTETPARPDRGYIRAVERDLTHPRLNAALGVATDMIQRRARGLISEPERVSEIIRDWIGGPKRPPSSS